MPMGARHCQACTRTTARQDRCQHARHGTAPTLRQPHRCAKVQGVHGVQGVDAHGVQSSPASRINAPQPSQHHNAMLINSCPWVHPSRGLGPSAVAVVAYHAPDHHHDHGRLATRVVVHTAAKPSVCRGSHWLSGDATRRRAGGVEPGSSSRGRATPALHLRRRDAGQHAGLNGVVQVDLRWREGR